MPRPPLTEYDRICRNEQWLSAWVGEEMMMMNGLRGSYFSLSESAGRIWELLEQPTSIAVLAAILQEEYGTEAGEITRNIHAFVEEMLGEDMVHAEPMPVH